MASRNEKQKTEPYIRGRYEPAPAVKMSLEEQFRQFCRFGHRDRDGQLDLFNLEKWIRQANVFRGRQKDIADIAITFKGLFRPSRPINLEQTRRFIEQLASKRSLDAEEVEYKLMACGRPQIMSPRLARRPIDRD